jgi:perosamine synthetase
LVLRDHGRKPGDKMFRNQEIAFKYKMSSLQAALGLAQIERIEELIERKRQIFSWYEEMLGHRSGLVLNHEAPGTKNTYWMVTVLVDSALKLDKKTLMGLMSEKNIDCRPFFYPLSSLPAYRDSPGAHRSRQRNPVSYRLSNYGINLPSGFNMTRETAHYVGARLLEILGSCTTAP